MKETIVKAMVTALITALVGGAIGVIFGPKIRDKISINYGPAVTVDGDNNTVYNVNVNFGGALGVKQVYITTPDAAHNINLPKELEGKLGMIVTSTGSTMVYPTTELIGEAAFQVTTSSQLVLVSSNWSPRSLPRGALPKGTLPKGALP